jgi:RHH-type rel operon transcriptional repressor/antitoxin RelB
MMLVIRLHPDIEDRLGRLARRMGRTKTYYAREAMLEHLDNLEVVHPAEQRYTALIARKCTTTALCEAELSLGVAD